MLKPAPVLAALVLASLPFVGGCASGSTTRIITSENQVSMDGRPTPGNGNLGAHYGGFFDTQVNHFAHSMHTLHWAFLHTNSENVPYERWHDDQLPRAMNTIGKTIDLHIFNYDWDDPFYGARW